MIIMQSSGKISVVKVIKSFWFDDKEVQKNIKLAYIKFWTMLIIQVKIKDGETKVFTPRGD